jgi:hypothetical protein
VDLAVLLTSYSEDDLIKYDRESRKQITTELQALCLRFRVILPTYLVLAPDKDDVYDKQAQLRGVTPKSILEYVNDDFDSTFSSLEEFRTWLYQQALPTRIEQVETPKPEQPQEETRLQVFFRNESGDTDDLVNEEDKE